MPGIASLSHVSVTIPELHSGTCQGLWDPGEGFGVASLIGFGKGELQDNLGMCPMTLLGGLGCCWTHPWMGSRKGRTLHRDGGTLGSLFVHSLSFPCWCPIFPLFLMVPRGKLPWVPLVGAGPVGTSLEIPRGAGLFQKCLWIKFPPSRRCPKILCSNQAVLGRRETPPTGFNPKIPVPFSSHHPFGSNSWHSPATFPLWEFRSPWWLLQPWKFCSRAHSQPSGCTNPEVLPSLFVPQRCFGVGFHSERVGEAQSQN